MRPEDTVERTLQGHPEVAVVFVRRGMACVGCDMASFETLAEVAAEYGQEPEGFLGALSSATGMGEGT